MIRVAIVEDHAAIAEGLAALLDLEGLRVVGIAGSAERADALIAAERPDVVLCDIMLNRRDAGFELLERHGRDAKFLMLSAYDYPAHHQRALQRGAAGYLSKMVDATTLADAVQAVARGTRVFPPAVLASAREAPRRPTAREHDLLMLLARGATNESIAGALGIRIKTVEGMLRRLFARYGIDNRTQLVRLASEQGWLASSA